VVPQHMIIHIFLIIQNIVLIKSLSSLFRNTDINNQSMYLNHGDNNYPCCHQSQLINGSHHALRYE